LNIPCIHCLTPNEVTLPPANSKGEIPSISVRCSACGNVFSTDTPQKKEVNPWDAPSARVEKKRTKKNTGPDSVEPPRRVPPAAAAYPHQPKYAPPQPPTYTINQDGNIYQVRDLAAVQRWIVENRLTQDGKISTDGQWWDRLGDRPEFKSFFEMLDRIQALEAQPEPATVIQSVPPPQIRSEPEIKEPRPASPEAYPTFAAAQQEPSMPEASAPPDDFEFTPPATEEIPFDEPHTDEHATTASMIAQHAVSEPIFAQETVATPEPPAEIKTEPAEPSIFDQYPSFSDSDLPTEEELQIATDEPEDEPKDEPKDEHDIAFVDEDWPTEQMHLDDDLEWVSAKQKNQRIALGLVLLVLIGITTKTFLGMNSEPTVDESAAALEVVATELGEIAEVDATDDLDEPAEVLAAENSAEADGPVSPASTESEPPAPRASRASTAQAPPVRRAPPPAREPETAESFMTTGRESMSEGDYRAARFAFLEAVAIEPQNPEANHGLAYAAHRQNDIPFAMRYYCRALSLAQPNSALSTEIQSSLNSLHLECEG
jgi:tetratricopeptide (TPR) repeat protein